ncbi:unnamed protein product [Brassica napus]|uniref:(rape) hypothetical protein n=1 Tax=Brassica napus TaxID=3708 RepID=A0A816WHQ5_BRANA|nr:unnamed protein product [Brassica napus]
MLGEEKGFNMDLFRGQRINSAKVALSYTVQGLWTVLNGYGLRDSKWSPFMKESWDNNLGISADLIVAQAVHHYIFLKIRT